MQLIDHNKNFEKFFFRTIFITLIFVSLDGLFQHFTGKNIIGLKEYTSDRTSGFFGDKGRLGSYIARLYPFALIYLLIYLQVKHKYKNYLFVLILNLFLVIVVYSGERISLFLMLISFFLLEKERATKNKVTLLKDVVLRDEVQILNVSLQDLRLILDYSVNKKFHERKICKKLTLIIILQLGLEHEL